LFDVVVKHPGVFQLDLVFLHVNIWVVGVRDILIFPVILAVGNDQFVVAVPMATLRVIEKTVFDLANEGS
jgi:hypothetical protein